MKIPDTPSQVLNALSRVTITPSQCRRHQVRQPKQQVRQPKQQVRPILIYTVLSQGNFLLQIYALFWRIIYRPKMRWCTKNDKYVVLYCIFLASYFRFSNEQLHIFTASGELDCQLG